MNKRKIISISIIGCLLFAIGGLFLFPVLLKFLIYCAGVTLGLLIGYILATFVGSKDGCDSTGCALYLFLVCVIGGYRFGAVLVEKVSIDSTCDTSFLLLRLKMIISNIPIEVIAPIFGLAIILLLVIAEIIRSAIIQSIAKKRIRKRIEDITPNVKQLSESLSELLRPIREVPKDEIDRFRHEYASQLNLYMNYYKHEVMQEDDNPPIGLLLCTDYGQTTVQYATEGLSQNLFVSKYRLQLPSEDDIRKYMLENITEEQFKELMEEEMKK